MAFHSHHGGGISWTTSDVLPVPHMFTKKLGDVGDYPYSSVPDAEWERPERQEKVRSLWLALRDAGGLPKEGICFTRQIHGTVLRTVGPEERRLPPLATLPTDCDGLITREAETPLCVFTADCVPILLCEPVAGIVSAVHSGWKGTAADIPGTAVKAICAAGGRAEAIRAAIGPAASGCCYETGPEVKEAVERLLGSDAAGVCRPEEGREGKYLVDLKEAVRRRLLQLGLREENIDVSPDCTICMADEYWSHRATAGRRGTQANIIMLPRAERGGRPEP